MEVTASELFDTALGSSPLQERQRVRLFARRDRFGRHWELPRLRAARPVHPGRPPPHHRHPPHGLRRTGFEYSAQVGESVLARLHFIIHTEPGTRAVPDLGVVEARIAEAARSWADDLSEALLEGYGEERGLALLRRYGDAFPAAYRDDFPARAAAADIARMESCAEDFPDIALSLAQPLEADGLLRFKLFAAARPLPLSDVMPLLENMGVRVLDQRPYEVRTDHGLDLDPRLRPPAGGSGPRGRRREGRLHRGLRRHLAGRAENDGFNRLVLGAGLTGREVAVLRAYSKYLRQVGLGVLPDLYGADPGGQPAHRPPAGGPVPRPLRPGPSARPRRRGQRRHQTARGRHRRRRQPRRGPHPPVVPGPGAGDAADQLVQEGRGGPPGGLEARPVPGARPAAAPAPLRDLRLLAPGRRACTSGAGGSPGGGCGGRTAGRTSAPRSSGS